MKSAITITVRLKSSRLEKKALKTMCGKTVIEHLIERLKKSKLADMIILCTSTNPQDDLLVEIAKKNEIPFFRGCEIDVLKRIYDAAKAHDVDFIISCTGDNPLTDPQYIDEIIKIYENTGADYITALDLPFGTFSYGVKVKAIKKVLELKKEKDTEVWGQYFNRSNLFKIIKVDVSEKHKRPDLRLTIDTQEDFELMAQIYESLYRTDPDFDLSAVIEFLDKNPAIKEKNQMIKQKTPLSIDSTRLLSRACSFMVEKESIAEIFEQMDNEKITSFIYHNDPRIIFLNLPNNFKGECEIHEKEDDLYLVLEGNGILYEEETGTRHIKGGDIVYIPKNKKHRIEEVRGNIKYIVVKIKNEN